MADRIGLARSCRRRGTTIVEAMISLALLGAAAGVFAQLYLLAGQQQRRADARDAAAQTLSNWMERCSQVPAAELSEERLTELVVLRPLKKHLPEVEPVAAIAEDGESPTGKRVTLSLRWPAADGVSREEIRLTAWRYPVEDVVEAAP